MKALPSSAHSWAASIVFIASIASRLQPIHSGIAKSEWRLQNGTLVKTQSFPINQVILIKLFQKCLCQMTNSFLVPNSICWQTQQQSSSTTFKSLSPTCQLETPKNSQCQCDQMVWTKICLIWSHWNLLFKFFRCRSWMFVYKPKTGIYRPEFPV